MEQQNTRSKGNQELIIFYFSLYLFITTILPLISVAFLRKYIF